MNTSVAWRYERKFLAPGWSPVEVLAEVWRHPAAFHEAYPPREVNNIYLDSPELRDYVAHVNGAERRLKTRVRWYGALNGRIAAPALDRKIKEGLLGTKSVLRLPPFALNGGLHPEALAALFDRAAIPDPLRLALDALHPTLINRYWRHYYVSGDGRFRLTVDSRLEFFHPEVNTAAMLASAPHECPVVIEVKFGADQAEAAERITTALPFRLTRCSKYVWGIERLAGH